MWFASSSAKYEVTGTKRTGLFGPSTVRRTVASKRDAERAERQMRRSGLTNVRSRRSGSWF
jgi:hypothetical protein